MSAVIVTGAEQGLGLELARQYAESGDHVIAACLNPRTEAILGLAASAPGLEVVPLDVTSEGSVAAFSDRMSGRPIDLLINNAGIHRRKGSVPESVVFTDWEDTFRVNTIGVARVSFALRENLARARRSKLVTISSDWGSVSCHPGTAYDYCSSKAAVNSLMRGLALSWNRQGTTVLMIHPGWTRTSMGGEAAPLLPCESAQLVRNVIAGISASDNGRFVDNRGIDMPW